MEPSGQGLETLSPQDWESCWNGSPEEETNHPRDGGEVCPAETSFSLSVSMRPIRTGAG